MYMLLTRWYCAVLLLYAPVHIKPSDLRLYNAADVDTVVFCGDSPARQAVEAAPFFSTFSPFFARSACRRFGRNGRQSADGFGRQILFGLPRNKILNDQVEKV